MKRGDVKEKQFAATQFLDRRAILAGLGATPFIGRSADAENFPTRPIRLVVPFGAGSIADIVARKVGDKAGVTLKQSFVIENRPGAGGSIGANVVAKAQPDGYTLCLGTVASHAIAAALEPLPYNLATDFKAVVLLVTSANLIAVNSSVPARTLPEYFDYARKKGGVSVCLRGSGYDDAAPPGIDSGALERSSPARPGRQGGQFVQ